MSNAGERVLVTGAAGVIGSWVCRELRRRGVATVGIDLRPTPAARFPETADVRIVLGDLTSPELAGVVIDAEQITRIIHLAAIVGDRCDRNPTRAIEVNGAATARLLNAAAAQGVSRIIAMSTKGALGPLEARYLAPTYDPVPPNLPPSPRTLYEASKYLVEVLVGQHRAAGHAASAMRLATTWGPGKSAETHGAFSVHSTLVARAARGEHVQLDVSPEQCYDLVYYADVARGLVDACLSDGALREPVYHIGSGQLVSMGTFVAAVSERFPRSRIELGEAMPAGRNCRLDITASTADFGYHPGFDFSRALDDYARYLPDAARPLNP